MRDALYTLLLVASLLLCVAVGRWVRGRLSERHLDPAATESIRLLMGMLLTFAALVLGLLTSNAKQRFDTLSTSLGAYSADLIELDQRLRVYGPDAAAIRVLLRSYTAAAIASSWPNEPKPAGVYPALSPDPADQRLDSRVLGALLDDVDLAVTRLGPQDPFHQQLASRLTDRAVALVRQRWTLVLSSRSTVSWPFVLTLAMWLCIIFAVFGLTAPPGPVVYAVVALSALSIASPLYLILDYDDALSGAIALPSQAMRTALSYMDGP